MEWNKLHEEIIYETVTSLLDAEQQQLSKIHRNQLKDGFLSSLGENSLNLLFSFAASSDSGLLIVAKSKTSNVIIGFLLATTNTTSFYKEFLRKNLFKALWIVLPKLFSISRIVKLMETLMYPLKHELVEYPIAELLDIAISREYQGHGIATDLFHLMVNNFRLLSINKFKITTGEILKGAQHFYTKLGAVQIDTIQVHKGENTIVYEYNI